MENYLTVSEKFTSIQGEGATMGRPAIFVRLAGCNLLCKGEWVCDSVDIWKKGVKTKIEEILTDRELERISEGHHLIVTGGEPLLHKENLLKFLDYVTGIVPFARIEIETNGTIEPGVDFIKYAVQWNVSPKLKNSGELKKKRYNDNAIRQFLHQGAKFKFVVNKKEDLHEIVDVYEIALAEPTNVYIMPAGETIEELNQTRLTAVEMAKMMGFCYSDRLHIVIWNKKTGV